MRYINLRFTYLLTRLVACLGFAYKGQSSTSRSRPGLAGDGSPPVHGVQEWSSGRRSIFYLCLS